MIIRSYPNLEVAYESYGLSGFEFTVGMVIDLGLAGLKHISGEGGLAFECLEDLQGGHAAETFGAGHFFSVKKGKFNQRDGFHRAEIIWRDIENAPSNSGGCIQLLMLF